MVEGTIFLAAQLASSWRDLVYPLGFVAAFAFMGRFALQWLISEAHRKSMVPKSFWQISLIANLLMVLHSILQVQFLVCLVQGLNAVISWRNLNFMQEKSKQVSFRSVLWLLGGVTVILTLIFVLQGFFFFDGNVIWARSPTFFWNEQTPGDLPLIWHILGVIGTVLFASRFWVQWWQTEQHQNSILSTSFWWLSIIGAALSLIYFLPMYDMVNLVGPTFGLIPYIRNLILIKRMEQRPSL